MKIEYIGKAIREKKKISLRKLAKCSDVAFSTIYKWEKGYCLPDLEPLIKVAETLNVEFNELIRVEK